MEKLGQLLAEDKWDLIVVDTPPSRNALDFLDAPKRLGSFMDSRLWRLLLAPGRGIGRLVTGAVGLAMKALSTILGSQMLSDAAGVRAVAGRDVRRIPGEGRPHLRVAQAARHPVRGGLGGRAGRVARGVVLRRPAVHRNSMPLAGLILNRTHPDAVRLNAGQAADGRRRSWRRRIPTRWPRRCCGSTPTRASTAKREVRLLSRFTGANPHVAIVGRAVAAVRRVGSRGTAGHRRSDHRRGARGLDRD